MNNKEQQDRIDDLTKEIWDREAEIRRLRKECPHDWDLCSFAGLKNKHLYKCSKCGEEKVVDLNPTFA